MKDLTEVERALGDLVAQLVADAEREGPRGGEHLRSALLSQGLYDIPFMDDGDVRAFTTWGSVVGAAARVPEAAAQLHSAGPLAPILNSMKGPAADHVAALVTAGQPLGLWLGVLSDPQAGTQAATVGQLRLEGIRHGVSGPAEAQDIVLAEPSPDGRHVHLVALSLGDQGVEADTMVPFGNISQRRLALDRVDLGPDRVIGVLDAEPPEGPGADAFARLELLLCFELVGLMQTALDRTLAYVRIRQQFGRAIGSFQAVQHMLADMAAATTVGRAIVDAAAAKIETGDPTARFDASVAKVMCSTSAVRACESAIQLHGGIGFTREARLDSLLVRARHASRAMGGADWHKKWLARHHDSIGL